MIAPTTVATLVIVPNADFELERIISSGDTNATLLSGMSGEQPIFVDPLPASTLAPTAYHGPTFEGVSIRAGVPCTIVYRGFHPAVPLRLTLLGRGDPRC